MMPKIEDRLTMCASPSVFRCGRKARVPCTTAQKLMSDSQSICAWSISSNEPISHAGIVDDDAERGMRGGGLTRELRDVVGLADVDAMQADLACGSDLGRERLQPGLVAIGEREIAAAPRKLDRQRTADAACRSGDGGGAADRCHDIPRQAFRAEL